jgi:uncharacterized protein (DUF1800 family)
MSSPSTNDETVVATSAEAEPADAAEPTASSSRRQLFAAGAAMAAAALLPRRLAAQRIVRPNTTLPKPPPASGDLLLRLVRRVTNGVTEEELALAKSLGFRRYLEYHLDYESINDSAVQNVITTRFPNLALDGAGLYTQNQTTLLQQLAEATLYRAAFSKRQLYERMVHFWSDHFNIYYPKVNYLKLVDDRNVVRANALGTFPDILRASAHSPAMLEYLDNTRSRRGNVNQNYARELMELHTLGVDGGYTQTDVEEVTRILTGWTIQNRDQFRFDSANHDYGAKIALGTNFPAMTQGSAQGLMEGENLLTMLIEHPSTAKFIALKMTRWLLQYDPAPTTVMAVADAYTQTGGDIRAMIRVILTPANLQAAPAKYRQPYQLVLAALRATKPTITNGAAISSTQQRILGQPLFEWEDPDGYPDSVYWWAGTILQRWNFASYLAGLATGNVIVDVAPLMAAGTPAGITQVISKRAFGGDMPAAVKAQVVAYLSAAAISTTRVREAFALALSSNAFQWY